MVSGLDWLVAAAVLYVLFPSEPFSYLNFLGIYILGQMAGLISHVPGGLGVFETVMIYFLSPTLPAPQILASLVVYRVIYYLLPLVAASFLLGVNELRLRRKEITELTDTLAWVPRVVPSVLGLSVFAGGVVLLLSGATPADVERLRWLRGIVPLPVLELSHFAGSLAGAGLLVLARGLQRRIDAAYFLTAILLAVGIGASLLKGLDYEEALLLSLMLAALLPSRREFYRRASLWTHRFSFGWSAAVVLALAASGWVTYFSFRHIEFSNELWWQFAFGGDAPRSLRALFGAGVVIALFGLVKLLSPGPHRPALPADDDMDKVRVIVAASPDTSSNLALLGDKAFLFNDDKTAFIMYGVEGRSWVAMGDPVGPEKEREELAWRFRELAERKGGWPVFYEVRAETLPLYLDLGLTILKLGEEGQVPLESLHARRQPAQRSTCCTESTRKGRVSFQNVLSGSSSNPTLPRLREISDAWLGEKNTKEKGFSLGFFQEDYIKNYPVATIWKEGRIVAFANVWLGAGKEEISIDLMRYQPQEAPRGVMEYMFIQLMLWGNEQGYHWFNLGMAPLSGMEEREFAPLWHRLGAFVFRHGEDFYNFQGLRQYKEKFHPVWEPRYLACPGGLKLPNHHHQLGGTCLRRLEGRLWQMSRVRCPCYRTGAAFVEGSVLRILHLRS